MVPHPTAEQMAVYVATARRRHLEEQEALQQRVQHAWALAHQAATLLRDRFGATRIVVFGSLIRPGMFTAQSDVDIAAWGIRHEDTLRAIGAVYDLSSEIRLALVDVNTARPALYEVITHEGMDL
jgi:uncharacterized protein